MVRAPFFDKNGVKKGAWSPEEDERLRSYIEKYGHWNWRELPKFAGLQRCGKSCRLRWMNYLRPEVKHGNYTKEEDELILRLHEEHGNRWSTIASKLPGRTDNEIKNHWNTNLKKRAAAESKKAQSSESFQADAAGVNESEVESSVLAELTPPHLILESSPLSPATSTSEFLESLNYNHGYVMGIPSSSQIYEGSINGDFWTEPCVTDNSYNNFGYDSSSYSLRNESEVPYDLLYDYTVDLLYQVMQDFPES